jgi:exopolyphosphatase / guanosine-5'-triphosphate,3'-diphosphate pyrophosphatase
MPTFAAVDIGSNSVRLKISRLASHRLVEIHEDREVTRLGEAVFQSGFLSPDAIAVTVKVLRRFHRAAQRAGADTVRVVATSALRDARNSQAFLEWVRSATGWKVEIISGIEEARLIHLGLTSSLRVNSLAVLMIDLGGGSCELTVSKKGHILETVSLPLGAVRLTNDFVHHDPPRKSEMRQLRSLIAREVGRVKPRILEAHPKIVIATSGTAESLARVCQELYRTKSQRGLTVSRLQMRRILKMLTRLSLEERRRVPGIGVRRAEIIVAGAAVYDALLEHCKLGGFRFSPLGLRDGLLAQMAAEYDRATRSGKQIESERHDSILAAVAHYRVDLEHATRVRESAMKLFHELRSIHRLPAEYREWIAAAAMLSEVGDYVNRAGRHHHTHYIISHSEILGYTPQQRRVIAAIARYLGKSRPAAGDGPIKVLPPSDQKHIAKASLLVRLAWALNLGRSGALDGIRVRIGEAAVSLVLERKPRMSVDLELWAVEKERGYFREVFGCDFSAAAA